MIRDKGWICALLLLPLALADCTQPPPAPPAASGPAASAPSALAPADAAFVNDAAQSSLFALRISKIAAERSNRQGIRDFAQSVVDQETKSANELAGIVQPHGLAAPQFLTPEQRRTADEMETAGTGAPLARIYFIAFVRDRIAALRTMQAYANSGADPALKTFAQEQVPVIQDQLARARRVPRQRGG